MRQLEIISAYLFAIALVVMFSYGVHLKLQHGNTGPRLIPTDQVAEEYQSDSSLDKERTDGKLTTRSSKWKAVRDEFIREHPECAACGSRKNLNAHHIKPFHEFPELELEPSNLIALCRGCHFYIGHDPDGPDGPESPNWSKSNPNVVEDARKARLK